MSKWGHKITSSGIIIYKNNLEYEFSLYKFLETHKTQFSDNMSTFLSNIAYEIIDHHNDQDDVLDLLELIRDVLKDVVEMFRVPIPNKHSRWGDAQEDLVHISTN